MPKAQTRDQMSKAHDQLYKEGQAIFDKHNPCQWSNGKCAGHADGCCGGCPHLGPNGCTVEALSCKLWLCWPLASKPEHKQVVIEIQALRDKSAALGVPLLMREPKESVLNYAFPKET